MASLETMESTAATRAMAPGGVMVSYWPEKMVSSPARPTPMPVPMSTIPRNRDATHSSRSWPYGWDASAARRDTLTPNQAMKVVSTSEKEWMASEIMAPECPHTPASSLKPESRALPIRLTRERRRMTAFSSRERGVARFDIKEASCAGRLRGLDVFSYAHSFFEILFRWKIK